MTIQREMHYGYKTRRIQYWECLPGSNWREIPRATGDDWPNDSYSYVRWPDDIPPPPAMGRPPRARW